MNGRDKFPETHEPNNKYTHFLKRSENDAGPGFDYIKDALRPSFKSSSEEADFLVPNQRFGFNEQRATST